MKKKYVVMFSVLITLLVVIYICIPKTKEEINNVNNKQKVNTNGFLTLMLEQDDGTYKKLTSNTWSGDGYAFNNELSGCERGGELVYDRETNIVKLISGGSDKCYVYFDKYINPSMNSITVTDATTSSISVSVSASGGTNNVATYYYSINNGEFTSSSSNTKTFTGLSKGTTYTIRVYVKDTNGVSSSVKTTSAQTESLTYICTTGTNLATCIKNQYTSQGTNGLYYHTSSLSNSAGDDSYRYAGSNPNNYVCFGSDASTCPGDNLYRIIGVFGSEVKLIKSTSYGDYMWAGGGFTWDVSKIRSILNTTYYNTISSTWQNKIATHTWRVGGMDHNYSYTARQYYDIEVGSSSSSTTDNMKIGLMYVSDYGYAASNSYWTTALYNYNSATSSNWLFLGSTEWTISVATGLPSVPNGTPIYVVYSTGNIVVDLNIGPTYVTRPSFYLTVSTTYVSGSGTSSDPIRIN